MLLFLRFLIFKFQRQNDKQKNIEMIIEVKYYIPLSIRFLLTVT